MRRGAAARLVGLALLAGVLAIAGFTGLAGADPIEIAPPGAAPISNGGWIAFSLSGTTSGSTVTLSPDTGTPPVTPTDLWGAGGNWPASWSGGGITLQLVNGPCSVAAHPSQSCQYQLSGSTQSGQPVVFGEGTFPLGPLPDQQNVSAPPPPPPPTTTTPSISPPLPSANFSGPPNDLLTGPGQFTFNAPSLSSEPSGTTFAWSLQFNGQQVDQGSGPSYTPPAGIFTRPGEYTLRLTAISPGDPTGVTQDAQFEIAPTNPPPPPTPTPGASPTPAAPSPAVSPPAFTHLSTVSYVPLSNFDVPTPAAIRPVTVIWLWRPDWFQTAEAARTAGRPSPAKRASVSLNAKGSAGPSATPWLAGLATFGIFGFAWILVRRRRVRTSILD
jgi:hypothetical protein